MKIGILGGTFNPVHFGHLLLAEGVRTNLSLDKIIFVPANFPPHKKNGDIAVAILRLKMV
ncbi:MAG TPA: nicotinic acid mononucleotide adenylyltransferase, partial [Candidatus Omnitrophica bacterium]|nr:nicotinic acid mononucleotide adenylyltransferase [Candidatus Omnitrophota bacterium]